jgi:hypothetical protein
MYHPQPRAAAPAAPPGLFGLSHPYRLFNVLNILQVLLPLLRNNRPPTTCMQLWFIYPLCGTTYFEFRMIYVSAIDPAVIGTGSYPSVTRF